MGGTKVRRRAREKQAYKDINKALKLFLSHFKFMAVPYVMPAVEMKSTQSTRTPARPRRHASSREHVQSTARFSL